MSSLHNERISNHNYTKEISYKDSYDETLLRIYRFNNQHQDALITFIIPTLNRNSLKRSLYSILKQNITNWKAIIIFDGCEPTDLELSLLLDNSRFLYLSIQRLGYEHEIHNTAGYVRNIGMSLVTTPWIGFVDDDDMILPNYIDRLIEEIRITPTTHLIVFRMIDTEHIIPQYDITDIILCHVGISFACKTSLFKEGFVFEQSEKEDYTFIKNIQNAKKKIVISPYITYIVRNSIYNINYNNLKLLNRIIINK
jgi:glycosyltransferase involved in cell wall biosynthesis